MARGACPDTAASRNWDGGATGGTMVSRFQVPYCGIDRHVGGSGEGHDLPAHPVHVGRGLQELPAGHRAAADSGSTVWLVIS